MQKYIVAGSIKGFLIIFWPKTKKNKFVKTFNLQDHTEENARIGGSRELLLFSGDLAKILLTISFQRKA